jgi:HSP20 family molecular chaperone IbpA
VKSRSATVKTYAVVEPVAASRNAVRKRGSLASGRSQRDCITLSDATDCLLEAYDCVARRAYEHFLERGPRPGGELTDWLNAERELLLGFSINVEHATQFIYAIASIPGATAARIEVGVEARWLVILAQTSRPAQVRRDESVAGVTRSFDLGLAIGRGKSPSAGANGGRDSRRGMHTSRATDTPIIDSSAPNSRVPDSSAVNLRRIDTRTIDARVQDSRVDDRGPTKSVCILELPATVDPARSIAILSDGLLAIRMPKITSRN